jgi:protein-tyrosine-phosphatase
MIETVLFVCYGNACRSPMAEGLLKKIKVEREVRGNLRLR